MTNQPYDGDHEGYDPYRQQPQGWSAQQQPYHDPQAHQQYPGQWQGQTWEAQGRQPVAPDQVQNPVPGVDGSAWQAAQGGPAAAYAGYQEPGYSQGGDHQGGYPSGGGSAAWDGTYDAAHDGLGQAPAGQPYGQAVQPQPGVRQAPEPSGVPAGSGTGTPGGLGAGTADDAGNRALTAAQRARLEGRSQIIEPGIQPAALTALLGLLLAGAATVNSYALLAPLVILQAVTAAGWFRLNGMWPARQGIALAFAGALAADAALLVADRVPAAILGTLGVWVLLTLVLQLRSHADPDERMYGLMATVVSAALSIIAAGHLAADADAVTVGAVAVAGAIVVRALPLPTPVSVVVALLAGVGAGVGTGTLLDIGSGGALLGGGAALCALIGHRAASYDYPSRFVHFTAGVALPLAAAAPAVYILGRALA